MFNLKRLFLRKNFIFLKGILLGYCVLESKIFHRYFQFIDKFVGNIIKNKKIVKI